MNESDEDQNQVACSPLQNCMILTPSMSDEPRSTQTENSMEYYTPQKKCSSPSVSSQSDCNPDLDPILENDRIFDIRDDVQSSKEMDVDSMFQKGCISSMNNTLSISQEASSSSEHLGDEAIALDYVIESKIVSPTKVAIVVAPSNGKKFSNLNPDFSPKASSSARISNPQSTSMKSHSQLPSKNKKNHGAPNKKARTKPISILSCPTGNTESAVSLTVNETGKQKNLSSAAKKRVRLSNEDDGIKKKILSNHNAVHSHRTPEKATKSALRTPVKTHHLPKRSVENPCSSSSFFPSEPTLTKEKWSEIFSTEDSPMKVKITKGKKRLTLHENR